MRCVLLFLLFLIAALPADAQTPIQTPIPAPTPTSAKLKVVSTFSILDDFVSEIGGEHVERGVIVGPDTDMHTYQPTPVDARKLAKADVLVSNGLGFEGWIDRLADAASFKGKRIVASAGAAAGSTGVDPHCWEDVACARRYVSNIADGLAAADPAHAAIYHGRAGHYQQKLAALDAWIRSEIATVPEAQRKAITGHDAFQYFARAYGVSFAAPRGFSTDSEPTARDVARLVREVREQKVRALFVENLTNPTLIDEIARDAGATVGPRLYSDALSKPAGPAPTYEAMMRYDVTALVAAMKGN